jgi:hypothetical protein
MKLYRQFLALARGKQIALSVSLIHICILFALLIHHVASSRLRPVRPIVVRTLSQPSIATSVPKKSTPVAAAAPTKKSAIAKPKAKPIAKKSAPAHKEKQRVQEIAESLETIRAETKTSRTALSIPSKIQPKAEIAPSKLDADPTYGEYLVAFLQNALDLPEYGEVEAKIEIDRYGHLVDCQILHAQSHKNADFLKNRLPDLAFPCLNGESHVFTITFRNVEMR